MSVFIRLVNIHFCPSIPVEISLTVNFSISEYASPVKQLNKKISRTWLSRVIEKSFSDIKNDMRGETKDEITRLAR